MSIEALLGFKPRQQGAAAPLRWWVDELLWQKEPSTIVVNQSWGPFPTEEAAIDFVCTAQKKLPQVEAGDSWLVSYEAKKPDGHLLVEVKIGPPLEFTSNPGDFDVEPDEE